MISSSNTFPFCKEMLPAAEPQDLTPVWELTHHHLRPFREHLPLPAESLRSCPLCGQSQAIALSVQLGFGGSASLTDAVVHYCPDCSRYSFDPTSQANLSEDIRGRAVTAVNARRWFASPTFLNIEPTTRCNFRCWYCIGRIMQQVDIRLADFEQVFKHFPSLQTIALVGEGEPLLHPDFFRMAEVARDRGVRVMITSNGSCFTEENIRRLCESGIAYVSVSIDSVDSQTFTESRSPGDLSKIWAGVEQLRVYRDQHGYRYPVIGLKGTLFPHTVDQLPTIIDEAWRRGMEVYEGFQPLNPMITYLPCYPADKLKLLASVGDVAAKIAIHSAAAADKLESISQFCARERIDFDKNGQSNGLRPGCNEQWVYTLASGDITPCCQIKQPISPNWNLFRYDLEAILADPCYENIRFNLWNGIFPVACSGCLKINIGY